jgi:hypothetical protein
MNKILLLSIISIFAVLGGSSIAVVHAYIIGDCAVGYQDGKNQAYSDFNAGRSLNDASPYYGE